MQDMYVDDLLTGAETISEAITLRKDVSHIINSAQFNLRKWIANDPRIIDETENNADVLKFIKVDDNTTNKTLGVIWNPAKDTLQYNIRQFSEEEIYTKRAVLSAISTTFDPLSLLGPVHITAKIFMQTLWKSKLQWDDPLQARLDDEWQSYIRDFVDIDDIKINRYVLVPNANFIELHGFCDASMKAYGACIYVKSKNVQGNCEVNLLCAKTRVSPLRCVTLPRLELCGAVLLARLMKRVKTDLNLKIDSEWYWCDSTIALCWINGEPSRWKTYVANRVAEVQSLSNTEKWLHVTTKDNAADILTRGCSAKYLQNFSSWWHGPTWLMQNRENWPLTETSYRKNENIPEAKTNKATLVAVAETMSIFDKYSNVNKLNRVMAYVLRFINNIKQTQTKLTGTLTVDEIKHSMSVLIKLAQNETYRDEIKNLKGGGALKRSSDLLQLNPFLDEFGLLRVGGRLKNANISYDAKHQLILPPKHKITQLIAINEHERHFHCGPQLLLAVLRERYWPVAGRNIIKQTVHRCVKCFRQRPKSIEPLMGYLPAERVNTSFDFHNCGVDFGGPFLIKDKKTRGCKQVKCYICIFVCFSTKAVHLELASDLSAACFLAALRRFVARRGKPHCIFSDNATNFIGTRNDLKHLAGCLQRQIYDGKLTEYFLSEEIKWKTIPPRTPNFAGLWESSVKSVKYHLKRVAGSASLVFEEFYTLLAQVEAILNSRPLSPMSSSPNDLTPLTPSHFLIGRPMTTVAEEDLSTSNPNRLARYQRIQQILQHFWKRWAKEYLGELQTRKKWKQTDSSKLEEGALVIVREDNLPPCKWVLGRVLSLIPGSDGVARVATIRTSASVIKRGVRKLCMLPIN